MTQKTAFITGADRGLGAGIARELLKRDWTVFAGQFLPEWQELSGLSGTYPDRLHVVPLDVSSDASVREASSIVAQTGATIDLLVNNAAIYARDEAIGQERDFDVATKLYSVNTLGPLRVVHHFLPLMDGGMKRLCVVSSESGCIERRWDSCGSAYSMSKAALNMATKIMFNDLRPKGFTFRLYHPGYVRSYMLGERNLNAHLEPDEAGAYATEFFLDDLENEDRLAMFDWKRREWPW